MLRAGKASSFKLYSQSSDKKNIKLSEGLLCFIDSAIFDPLEGNWCSPRKNHPPMKKYYFLAFIHKLLNKKCSISGIYPHVRHGMRNMRRYNIARCSHVWINLINEIKLSSEPSKDLHPTFSAFIIILATDLSQLSSWSFLCCVAATASCRSVSVWHLTAPAPAATRSVVCFPCSRHRPPDTLCALTTLVTPPWEWTSTISLCWGSAHVHVSGWLLSLGRSLRVHVFFDIWNIIMKVRSCHWRSVSKSKY